MSNQALGPYVIGERVGTTVWIAEDTRNGKRVAIKLLTKALPKDEGRRETLVREVRVAAALYHAFLVPILEIAPIGDHLVMVMEVVEGQPIPKKLRGQPLGREEFFRIAYQLATVTKYLHTKALLHGNLNGDAVMVTPEGQVKLGGLNMSNLLRRERTSSQYQQKGSDERCVGYIAPEQISSQVMDEKTDIFSIGVILYEIATGKLPFPGNTAADVARAIVEGNPVSPKSVNPAIENPVMSVLGGCLFKDPFKRQKDAKALVDLIERLDSSAVEFAVQLERKLTAGAAATPAAEQRRSILFIADVANYDALLAENPEAAAKAAARMQQVLGEGVYLFDGKVVDPFGTRLIAELPSIESALEAGRKGEFDFSPEQTVSISDRLKVRMLLHAGELEINEGVVAGAAVERAIGALEHLTPNTLFISEEFVKEGRGQVRLRDAGAKGGLKLFTIVPAEPPAPEIDEPEPTTADIEAELAAEAAELAAAQRVARKRQLTTLALAASVVVLIGIAVVLMWSRRGTSEPVKPAVAAAPVQPAHPTAARPQTVHLAAFTVEVPDPVVAERANAIRLGAAAILKSFPELRVAETAAADTPSFSARVRLGATGAELVPVSGAKSGNAVPLLDSASGIRTLVEFVIAEVKAQPRSYAAADALNSFADALVARSLNDNTRADASLRAAMQSDPRFLPAQLAAMEFFALNGKEDDAIAAAKQVVALDPANLNAARKVARASLIMGDLQQSFALYQLVLDREPRDAEALNLAARYSLATGNAAQFNSMLARLQRLPAMQVAAHAPDLVAVSGRLSTAVDRYYDIPLARRATSPALQLKIGRLSILRHSVPLAEDELKKLEQSDPLYGYHMLRAYMAAENRNRDEAVKELETALRASQPGDDSWTSAAEVYAILNDTSGVITSLERAAQRKEPTAAYILANPLFKYLENDPRFAKLRVTLTEQQVQIRTALAQVR